MSNRKGGPRAARFSSRNEPPAPIILLPTRAICPWEPFRFFWKELLMPSPDANFMRVFFAAAPACAEFRPLATSMRDIETEYNRVRQTNHQIGGVAFFSSEHKKSREWHVLGAVQQLLLQAGLDAPTSADESETPDFHTYDSDGRAWASIEIVEVLRPDYKRHSSYKAAARPNAPAFYELPPPLEFPWEPMRKQIRDKARKNYPTGICLVVYHDIGRMSFPIGLLHFTSSYWSSTRGHHSLESAHLLVFSY